jgi:hypothetical protein
MKHSLPKIKPVILLKFDEPHAGWWDGGMKGSGVFYPRPNSDGTIEWGSFGLNVWFRVKFGHSWKHAAAFARRVIARNCKVPCTTKIEWQPN